MATDKQEIIDCLKEMREANAACFRVIANRIKSVNELEQELAQVRAETGYCKDGFGARCQDLIKKLEEPPLPSDMAWALDGTVIPDAPGEYYFSPHLLVQVKQDEHGLSIYWGDIRLGLVKTVCGVWQKRSDHETK